MRRMECKMIGILESQNAVVLVDDLLMALSFARKRKVERTEIRLRSTPSQGVPAHNITLLQESSSALKPGPWHVKSEGPPKFRGRKQAKESEVTCRPIATSTCEGGVVRSPQCFRGKYSKLLETAESSLLFFSCIAQLQDCVVSE